MRKTLERTSLAGFDGDSMPATTGTREILIPHTTTPLPLTAVRNVFIQSSLAGLQARGYYDRYAKLMDADVLSQLQSSLAPGWVPVELATAHYQACDGLMLSAQELNEIGGQVGHRLQESVLITSAKRARDADFDMWDVMLALHRMWGRLYQGVSVQVVKLGAREKLIETRGLSLFRFHYYRQTSLAAISASYRALGAHENSVRLVNYSAKTHEMVVRTSW